MISPTTSKRGAQGVRVLQPDVCIGRSNAPAALKPIAGSDDTQTMPCRVGLLAPVRRNFCEG